MGGGRYRGYIDGVWCGYRLEGRDGVTLSADAKSQLTAPSRASKALSLPKKTNEGGAAGGALGSRVSAVAGGGGGGARRGGGAQTSRGDWEAGSVGPACR